MNCVSRITVVKKSTLQAIQETEQLVNETLGKSIEVKKAGTQ
jgi:hypothetical protein